MQHFETTQWLPHPVELVFAFFANPYNLPHLMPPALEVRVEDVRMHPPPPRPEATDPARRFKSMAAGEGTEILVSFYPVQWFPQRLSWTTHIVEFSWNSHFVDKQVRGPFKSFHHRHEIVTDRWEGQEGTRITDRIDYALPGGIVGLLITNVIRQKLEKSFAFRQKRLPEILAAAARQAVRRATP